MAPNTSQPNSPKPSKFSRFRSCISAVMGPGTFLGLYSMVNEGRRKRHKSVEDEERKSRKKSSSSDKKEKHKDKKSHKRHSETDNKDKKLKDKHKDKDGKGDQMGSAGSKPENDILILTQLMIRKELNQNYEFKELTKDDYFSKNNEFATWLKDKKKIFFSDLSAEAARDMFTDFIKAWNKHKLDSRYYEGIVSGPRTAHKWKIKA
ncbi:hypothetical protein F8388_007448 [Cannabis sativa]|uniref:Uncharacterized protein n=1 Tax=Cannabis sativa TaxID=3483 RepID=A0A7J6F4M4_CANSA|nr:hypothetical protein F8388_007448 [Cannabis sativa]